MIILNIPENFEILKKSFLPPPPFCQSKYGIFAHSAPIFFKISKNLNFLKKSKNRKNLKIFRNDHDVYSDHNDHNDHEYP